MSKAVRHYAAEAIAPMLALPSEQRINGIIASARRVHQALSGTPVTGPAADLREEIEFFTAVPMKALPR